MKQFRNMSIRRKLFYSMLIVSVAIVIFITGIAVRNTYRTMQEQLIYNRRMSIGWLQDRLELEIAGYQERFYEFEVNRSRKAAIEGWSLGGEELDYTGSWELITAMNEVISMDSNLNSMELFNLPMQEVIVAQRSGASVEEAGERIAEWKERPEGMQSNLFFIRSGREILAAHRMHRFSDKLPFALLVMHIRPYAMQNILADIKMTPDESVIVLNDSYQIIEADYGSLTQEQGAHIAAMAERLEKIGEQELVEDGNYWFLREVSGGKLKVMLSVPDQVIRDSLKGTIAAAVLSGTLMIFFCAAASVLFARVFSGPIIALSEKMRHFTLHESEENSGEVKEDGVIRERKDEVGILQDSFHDMVERNQRLIAQEYQLEAEKREAQIHALQAQINPHFMYNIMQVIGGMALKRKAHEIYAVTTALGDLMRYCLNFSRETVCLKEEIHYLESYCRLQNERFEGRVEFKTEIPEELLEVPIPKLILQPILENSFHHGLPSKKGSWEITVRGEWRSETDYELTVTDNGTGIAPDKLKELQSMLKQDRGKALKSSGHIGLQNVNARIRIPYPEGDYGVRMESTEGEGTKITLQMRRVDSGQDSSAEV